MSESSESEPSTDGVIDSRLTHRARGLDIPAVGQVVGSYRLLEQIGAGGFSLVWRAEHVTTGEIVAIKLPRVPDFIAHLRREALIGTHFRDPQVIGIIELRLDHDPPFLVTPFVPGSDLQLPDVAPPPEDMVTELRRFRRIAEVVACLHDADIVHGDLKPGNIRFDPAGACFLLDLGLARHHVSVRQSSTLRASIASVTGEKIAGTLEFMAPEVMSGKRPARTADVYALGVILHTQLCGRPPAFGVSPAELNPFLPPGMTDFLRQALHPDPERRLPSAGALLPAVDEFIRAEERCLRRRNGHARRRVFHGRMRTLARGIRVLGCTAVLILLLCFGLPSLEPALPKGGVAMAVVVSAIPLGFLAFLLGVTTMNAWILGVPGKSYKNRSGHPWWTFMMQ